MQCASGISGRVVKTVVFFLLLLFSFPLLADEVSSLDQDLEPWLLLEKGKGFYRDKDFSTALNYFLYTQDKAAVFPEVEYWIGRIYEEEGEFLLAEQQYLKAYEQKKYLYISDQQYEIAYRLSQLYLNRQRWDEYENILLEIIHQELQKDLSLVQQEHQMMKVLKEDGIDELFYLYRRNFTFSVRAFRELGIFYYKMENYRSASIYSLYAVMAMFSSIADGILEVNPHYQYPRNLDQLKEWDPDYLVLSLENEIQKQDFGFSFPREKDSSSVGDVQRAIEEGLTWLEEHSLNYHFSGILYSMYQAKQRPALLQYLDEGMFYQSLYYLSSSLYAEGYREEAMHLWTVLSFIPEAGDWMQLSLERLNNPGLDEDHFLY